MTSAIDRAARARSRYTAFMVRIVHADGAISRVTTAYRNIDWDADDGAGETTWRGAGLALSLDLPEQGGELQVSEFALTLSGLSADFRWLAGETVRGLSIRIWLAFIGPDGRVVATELVEDGLQDRVSWGEDESRRQSITLYCLGGMVFLANQSIARWSTEQQRAYLTSLGEDPDSDTGFDAQHGIPDDASGAAWWPPA